METLSIKDFGPIKHVQLSFGDLTIIVGPQASGKSLALQMLKLLADSDPVIREFEKYGYTTSFKSLMSSYLGEGMGGLWTQDTEISLNGKNITKDSLKKNDMPKPEKIFYIPAHRILSVNDGRPKPFMEFDNTAPYVLRHFSESVRLLLQNGLGDTNVIFPISARLKSKVIQTLNRTIYHDSTIVLETRDGQKKMRMKIDGANLPFMTWSTGQKEYTPLLMGLYCVSGPPNKIVNKDSVERVIIEEPEMGLHPWAIVTFMLQVMLLIASGKKVILSTHSTVPLEFAWAYNYIKNASPDSRSALIGQLFRIPPSESKKIFEALTDLDVRTYYLDRQPGGAVSRDITALDPASTHSYMAEWGGLSEFSTHASEIISTVVANQ